ncbi:Cytochrome P450 2F5 [Plecturocebus cupreus]
MGPSSSRTALAEEVSIPGSCPHPHPQSHFHMGTLLMTTHNLLFGGTETAGTTLCHAFLALMKYLKVQGEAHPHGSSEVPMWPQSREAPPCCQPRLLGLI